MENNQKLKTIEGGNSPVASHRYTMRQLENALYEHSGVEEVAVFFVPDNNEIERLIAFIVPRGPELDKTEVMKFLKEMNLEPEYLPEAIKFVPKMPKSPSGKVLKLRLLEDMCPAE